MKICIIGLGSIGCRHLKNITKILCSRGVSYTIDALRSSDGPLQADILQLIDTQYTEIDSLPSDYDVAFVTNPTRLHYETVLNIRKKTKHMFIEKPVFDRSDIDLSALELTPENVYYVACPMRYMKVTRYLKKFVKNNEVFSARAICSSYLPEWRPNTDYRDTYSARKELGGGVSIDLIHEWDYLCYLFGKPDFVYNLKGTYSRLEIDTDDLSVYIGKYPDKLISLHLDYFGRYQRREVELYIQDDVVVGDFIRNQIHFLKTHKTIDLSEQRNDYQLNEISCFFDMIEGKAINHNPLDLALQILKLTKGEPD
ncbi:MAG: Gfo/Idh/MocA family oxidoreductase [Eubacteriales bacterium]|nr:Gfo/Idh/MocA family oxidoreductase [Eubacteriales bacterium]